MAPKDRRHQLLAIAGRYLTLKELREAAPAEAAALLKFAQARPEDVPTLAVVIDFLENAR